MVQDLLINQELVLDLESNVSVIKVNYIFKSFLTINFGFLSFNPYNLQDRIDSNQQHISSMAQDIVDSKEGVLEIKQNVSMNRVIFISNPNLNWFYKYEFFQERSLSNEQRISVNQEELTKTNQKVSANEVNIY